MQYIKLLFLFLLFSCTKQTVDSHSPKKVQLQTTKQTSKTMAHPAEDGSEVLLAVTSETQISAQVVSSVFNTVDGAYHYNLQCQMTDGNNVNTVQVNDVYQELVILLK